jgi:cellulose synthase/poly-beta-1,6-N-acetylglucosamine synthase-like glycosyltransferase
MQMNLKILLAMSQILFEIYGYAVFFYSFTLMLTYVALMYLAARGYYRNKNYVDDSYAKMVVNTSPFTPGVSIIAPAFNEEKTIVDNVKSLLSQQYPLFEVIIVNDGSKDSTLQKLIDYFDLKVAPFSYEEKLQTRPFKALYRSVNPAFKNLTVVDKENGGTKADPVNCGLNVAQYEYFINTDVDCILELDAIYQCMLPIFKNPEIIAVSGMMTMSNGCTIENGMITKLAPPKNPIPLFQELEYLRSFVIGKMGWSSVNAMSNVSGGFGLFKRDVCIQAGGYSPDSFAEDMDVLFRMIAYCCENNIKYRVVQIPKTCCRTEGPNSLYMLNRQRTRWGRGLIQVFHQHYHMLFNYKYHRIGLLTLPYVFIYEFCAPVIECMGFFVLVYLFLNNEINWLAATIIGASVYAFFLMLSSVVIFFTYKMQCEYKHLSQYIPLALAATVEPLFYHPLIVLFSLRGYFEYIIGKKAVWKTIARKGYDSTDKSKQS